MGSHLLTGRRRRSSSAGQARAILNDLRLLVRELRVSARDAEKRLGISGAQLFVLQCLGRDDVLSMNELAERTHTDQSSVSVVVSRLVHRKLVRFTPEANQARLAQALAAMSPQGCDRLARGLQELVTQMGIEGAPRMFFEDDDSPARSRGVKKRASRG